MIRYLTLLATVFLLSANAHADFSSCVDQYDLRETPGNATFALDCFKGLVDGNRDTHITVYRDSIQYAMQTAYWIFLNATPDKRTLAVLTGLNLAEDAMKKIPMSGLGYYWSGMFQLARCGTFDPRMQRKCIQQATPAIMSAFSHAWNIEPAIHGYGPARMLGVMNRSLAFPDIARVKKYVGDAYNSAPNFSSNTLEVAKTLIFAKDPTRARQMLEDFLSTSCRSMDPSRIPECNLDRAEANKILRGGH